MATEAEPAPLGCGEVLALLDAFVDGALPPRDRLRVEAHVAGCDNCARFGGHYAAVVTRLRAASAPPAPAALRARILGG